jgi:hypothetical protein
MLTGGIFVVLVALWPWRIPIALLTLLIGITLVGLREWRMWEIHRADLRHRHTEIDIAHEKHKTDQLVKQSRMVGGGFGLTSPLHDPFVPEDAPDTSIKGEVAEFYRKVEERTMPTSGSSEVGGVLGDAATGEVGVQDADMDNGSSVVVSEAVQGTIFDLQAQGLTESAIADKLSNKRGGEAYIKARDQVRAVLG